MGLDWYHHGRQINQQGSGTSGSHQFLLTADNWWKQPKQGRLAVILEQHGRGKDPYSREKEGLGHVNCQKQTHFEFLGSCLL